MKFSIPHSSLDQPYPAFLRSVGYLYIESWHTGKGSFARALGNGHYPRFHIYVDDEVDHCVFNIHIDQKQASYEGTAAHAGEYDGPLVEREAARIKSLARPGSGGRSGSSRPAAPDSGRSADPRASRFSSILRGM